MIHEGLKSGEHVGSSAVVGSMFFFSHFLIHSVD
jgi:hypothetical protein